jgi:hypothetical protein
MRKIQLATAVVLAVAGGLPALGQGAAQDAPHIDSINFTRQPYIGDPSFDFSDTFDYFFFFFGFYQPLGFWGVPRPFDPLVDVAQELDLIVITMIVTDQDLTLDPNDPNSQEADVEFHYRLDAFGSDGPPAAPPLVGATNLEYTLYQQPPRVPDLPKAVRMDVYVWVPKFLGANQKRLRGEINYDVLWSLDVRVANSDSPSDGEWDARQIVLKAIENNRFLPPNPPPYADAGPDQRVKIGSTVRLNGSRSFDSSNLGFDPNDLNVFLKDQLEYAWEWISGPEQVSQSDFTGAGTSSPYASVRLDTLTTNDNPYVFRLTVSDHVNSPPSSDVVRIYVVQDLPRNREPTAVILGTSGQPVDSSVPVQATAGDTIQFKARAGPEGADPDGDVLDYRWRQTNAVGGGLLPDEVATVFLPMKGMDQQEVSWQAVAAGTYYLALTVTDPGGLSNNARVTIAVAEGASGSGQAASTQSPRTRDLRDLLDGNAPAEQSATPAGCGAGGLLPLALVPGVLGLLRRRYR